MFLSLVLLPPGPFDDALGLGNAWIKAHPSFEARTEVQLAGVNGRFSQVLRFDRATNQVFFQTTTPAQPYVMRHSVAGYLEVDHTDRVYDEIGGSSRYGLRPSRTSTVPKRLMPQFLMARNFSSLIPTGSTRSIDENATWQGKPSLALHASLGGPPTSGRAIAVAPQPARPVTQGTPPVNTPPAGAPAGGGQSYEVWLNMDPASGAPQSFRLRVVSMEGTIDTTWSVTSVRAIQPTADTFALAPPVGYSPYSLYQGAEPIEANATFATTGWSKAGANFVWPSAKGRTVVAVLTPGDRLTELAERVLSQLESKGVSVIRIADTPERPADDRYIYSADGKSFADIEPSVTPYFYVLDADNTVYGSWMGVTASEISHRVQEILDATKTL